MGNTNSSASSASNHNNNNNNQEQHYFTVCEGTVLTIFSTKYRLDRDTENWLLPNAPIQYPSDDGLEMIADISNSKAAISVYNFVGQNESDIVNGTSLLRQLAQYCPQYTAVWDKDAQPHTITITDNKCLPLALENIQLLKTLTYIEETPSSYKVYLTDAKSIETLLNLLDKNKSKILDADKILIELHSKLGEAVEFAKYNTSAESNYTFTALIENNVFKLKTLDGKSLKKYNDFNHEYAKLSENDSAVTIAITSAADLHNIIIPLIGKYGYQIKDIEKLVAQTRELLKLFTSHSVKTINYKWQKISDAADDAMTSFMAKTNRLRLVDIKEHEYFKKLLENKTVINGVTIACEKDIDDYIYKQGWEHHEDFEIINIPTRIGSDPACVDLSDYNDATKIHRKFPGVVLAKPPQRAIDIQLAIDDFLEQLYQAEEEIKLQTSMQMDI